MVPGEDDHGVLQLAGLLQRLDGVLQSLVQLHVAGQIGPGGLAHVQIRHLIPVLGGHGVAGEAVIHVAAHRHIVVVEGLLSGQSLGEGQLHHLQVGLGPGHGHIQPGVTGVEIIAQVGVGEVAVIVVGCIVVVGQGGIAQGPELVAHGEVHGDPVFSCIPLGGIDLVGGDQAGGGGILPIHRGVIPQGVVEVLKHKAGVGQLV